MSLQRLACIVLVTLVTLPACETMFGTDATIDAPPNALGKPLIVVGLPGLNDRDELPLDDRGVPLQQHFSGGDAYDGNLIGAQPALASQRLRDDEIGDCPRAYYVMAWFDLDDSSGLLATLAGSSQQAEMMSAALHAKPSTGDLISIAGPFDFGPKDLTAGCSTRWIKPAFTTFEPVR